MFSALLFTVAPKHGITFRCTHTVRNSHSSSRKDQRARTSAGSTGGRVWCLLLAPDNRVMCKHRSVCDMLGATRYGEQWGYKHGVSDLFRNNSACRGFRTLTLDEQYGVILGLCQKIHTAVYCYVNFHDIYIVSWPMHRNTDHIGKFFPKTRPKVHWLNNTWALYFHIFSFSVPC